MCNIDIRTAAQKAGVYLYQIAKEMGISTASMTIKMRYEMPQEEKKNFLTLLRTLKQKNK